jgi:hypothetical protein
VETRPFAKSTLQEFRAQLILHEQTRAIFQRSLEVAKHRGLWKKGKAPDERQHIKLALDTTHILGRGAVRDTYNLLADGIIQVLRGLAALVKCDLLEVAEELDCMRYASGSSLKGQAEVDWSDPRARQRFLGEIVADAEHLLEVVRGTRSDLTADSPEDQALVAAADLLARILAQDIERDDQGPRLKRGVAPDRAISVHDLRCATGARAAASASTATEPGGRHGDPVDHRGRRGGGQCAGCRARPGGGRRERSGNGLPGRGGTGRLRVRRG